MKHFILFITLTAFALTAKSQCTTSGNQTSYGTNNVWIGYVYDNMDFTNYRSYVNEGATASPNFDENFGGDDVTYNTTGCSIQTSTFSVRYKLTKTFASGNYTFTVGGDDGLRLSLDGGSTWVINHWNDQSYTSYTYTTTLNGTYNMVLEYYENGGGNRISFNVTAICMGTENTSVYGTNNVWRGYIYDGTNFDLYSGVVTEGTSSNPAFDESFGGSNVTYATSACGVQTETFSARYRLTKTFANGTYNFTVGGDDGYRLSVDGGSTWVINRWNDQSYVSTTSSTMTLNGTYNMVLEYYENGGENRISFAMQTLSLLPVTLEFFNAQEKNNTVELNWGVSSNSDPKSFEVERSADGTSFTTIRKVQSSNNSSVLNYNYTDANPVSGVAYYRLKITDLTDVITYSTIISVRTTVAANDKIAFYPNVITDNYFQVKANKNIKNAVVTISDLSGRIISKQNIGTLTAGQPSRISTGNGKPGKGMYIVVLSGNESQISTGKIIIQ
ncbi:MAG: PA14 domain-containing protein [Agriterribacter sp.]